MSTTTQPPKPKRRWCQFSLKTLLVVMTVATVAFGGWVQYMRYRAQKNRERVAARDEAVAAILELGGWVMVEVQTKVVVKVQSIVVEEAPEPKELRPQTWLEKQFDDPGGADDPDIAIILDANLVLNVTFVEHLTRLTNLKTLFLERTKVTDAGLAHLIKLTKLQRLNLADTDITDSGLEHLKGLTSLRFLDLRGTNVTNEGVKKLQQALPNCKIER